METDPIKSEGNDCMETSPTEEEGNVIPSTTMKQSVDEDPKKNEEEWLSADPVLGTRDTYNMRDNLVAVNELGKESTGNGADNNPEENLEIHGFDTCAVEEARHAIDLLRGDDVAGRISAVQRLDSIAAVLGERRTREELIPFLTESGADDEDEVLAALASALGKLVPYVGGKEYAHIILQPLEVLLTFEEIFVRDIAVETTLSIAHILPDTMYQKQYADMISRLATKEWFTARMSSCGLIASSLGRISSENQEPFIEKFASLCRDDNPMVRRVASQHLGTLLKSVVEGLGVDSISQNGVVDTILIPLYEELAANDQDSVRLQTTENCVAFGNAISLLCRSEDYAAFSTENIAEESNIVKRVLPLVVQTIDDRSWRVRWTAASKFADVVTAFSDIPGTAEPLINAYEKLLQDPEAEVRTAATFNLVEVAQCKALVSATSVTDSSPDNHVEGKITVANRLVKRISSLTEDESEHVRAALATVATELAPIVGKETTISQIVPPVLLLLRDAASEVRLNLISSLSSLNEVIGVELLAQTLIGAIEDLARDPKWRTRLSIIQHFPLLAKQMGKTFFCDKLSSLSVGWLGDSISTIRQAAANNLMELTSIFGAEWAMIHLIPSLVELRNNQSYLHRLTAIQACASMSTAMNSDAVRTKLLPMILEMANDTVPNIRFNVAKALEKMAPVCGESVCNKQIHPVLSVLTDDMDRDVRFFSLKGLESIEKEFGARQS